MPYLSWKIIYQLGIISLKIYEVYKTQRKILKLRPIAEKLDRGFEDDQLLFVFVFSQQKVRNYYNCQNMARQLKVCPARQFELRNGCDWRMHLVTQFIKAKLPLTPISSICNTLLLSSSASPRQSTHDR